MCTIALEWFAWLHDWFQKAPDKGYAGLLVVIQADVYFPFELSDGGYADDFLPQLDDNNGYADFLRSTAPTLML